MFVVDANILIYAVNTDARESDACASLLETWMGGDETWFLTWGIVYEFLGVVTHRRMPHPLSPGDAWSFVSTVTSSPLVRILTPTERHMSLLRDVLRENPTLSGNLLFDVRTAVLMREHGIRRIITRDRDFRRFPFLEAVDPLA